MADNLYQMFAKAINKDQTDYNAKQLNVMVKDGQLSAEIKRQQGIRVKTNPEFVMPLVGGRHKYSASVVAAYRSHGAKIPNNIKEKLDQLDAMAMVSHDLATVDPEYLSAMRRRGQKAFDPSELRQRAAQLQKEIDEEAAPVLYKDARLKTQILADRAAITHFGVETLDEKRQLLDNQVASSNLRRQLLEQNVKDKAEARRVSKLLSNMDSNDLWSAIESDNIPDGVTRLQLYDYFVKKKKLELVSDNLRKGGSTDALLNASLTDDQLVNMIKEAKKNGQATVNVGQIDIPVVDLEKNLNERLILAKKLANDPDAVGKVKAIISDVGKDTSATTALLIDQVKTLGIAPTANDPSWGRLQAIKNQIDDALQKGQVTIAQDKVKSYKKLASDYVEGYINTSPSWMQPALKQIAMYGKVRSKPAVTLAVANMDPIALHEQVQLNPILSHVGDVFAQLQPKLKEDSKKNPLAQKQTRKDKLLAREQWLEHGLNRKALSEELSNRLMTSSLKIGLHTYLTKRIEAGDENALVVAKKLFGDNWQAGAWDTRVLYVRDNAGAKVTRVNNNAIYEALGKLSKSDTEAVPKILALIKETAPKVIQKALPKTPAEHMLIFLADARYQIDPSYGPETMLNARFNAGYKQLSKAMLNYGRPIEELGADLLKRFRQLPKAAQGSIIVDMSQQLQEKLKADHPFLSALDFNGIAAAGVARDEIEKKIATGDLSREELALLQHYMNRE